MKRLNSILLKYNIIPDNLNEDVCFKIISDIVTSYNISEIVLRNLCIVYDHSSFRKSFPNHVCIDLLMSKYNLSQKAIEKIIYKK